MILMRITILLGKTPSPYKVEIEVDSPDCLIGEVLDKVRSNLHPSLKKWVLQSSEKSGSKTFLSNSPDGPIKLEEHMKLSDYHLSGDHCTLWLFCSHEAEEMG